VAKKMDMGSYFLGIMLILEYLKMMFLKAKVS
jgi:hypothetical protein